MKNILDQDWFHPDIQWHQFDHEENEIILNRSDILAGIDHWCNILKEVADFGPGSTCVSMQEICDIRYLTLMFAVWRLGGCLVSPTVDLKAVPQIDCVVYNQGHTKDHNQFESVSQSAKHMIEADVWFDFVADTTNSLAWPRVLGTDRALMLSAPNKDGELETTSYTHEFFVALCNRNQELFDFSDIDRVLHLHVINHGGAEGQVFLPTLKYCKHHYFDIGKDLDRHPNIVDRVAQQKINHIFCLGGRMLDNLLKLSPRFDHAVSFYQLSANFKYWVSVVKEKNIKQIVSLYGATATVGPVFLNIITQDTNLEVDVLNYGTPRDDFYQVRLTKDHELEVTNQYRGVRVIHDHFTQDLQGNFIFHHKNKYVRIRNVYVMYDFFESVVTKHAQPGLAYLVPDPTFDHIYLLIDQSMDKLMTDCLIRNVNHELGQYSKFYSIDHVEITKVDTFLVNEILNLPQVRLFFRQKINSV